MIKKGTVKPTKMNEYNLTIKRATSTKIKCKQNRIPTKITYKLKQINFFITLYNLYNYSICTFILIVSTTLTPIVCIINNNTC